MDPYGGLATLLGNLYTFLAIIGEFIGLALGFSNYLIYTLFPFLGELLSAPAA